jgi:hypothetical protein
MVKDRNEIAVRWANLPSTLHLPKNTVGNNEA